MIGLVMAGGRGTRMDSEKEKLLLVYKKPVVLHVVDALSCSGCVSGVAAATSGHSPRTESMLSESGVKIIRTPGEGYVPDLIFALKKLDGPVLVVSGDMPLLDSQIIREIVSKHKEDCGWQSFVVTKDFLQRQKMRAEFSVTCEQKECYYTGVSIVNPAKLSSDMDECLTILDDKRIALNLNTVYDYSLLEDS